MGVPVAVARLRHHLRRPLTRTPYLWDIAMYSRPSRRGTLARPDTAIVIEGFERSGNTFSVASFIVANGTQAHVGRHLHAASHVIRAVRLGLPTVVLIRPPRDAVLSYLVRYGSLTPSDAILAYIDFYRSVWSVRDRFVVGLFDEVVTDFGAVLDEVNQQFGTRFRRWEPTAANQEASFRLVEEMNRRECHGNVVETHVGRPSGERDERKQQLGAVLDHPRTSARLLRAQRIYEAYVGWKTSPRRA